MPNPNNLHKNEQISLSQHQALKAKQKKKIIDLPVAVKLIFAIPFVFFIILLLGYIFYIRQIALKN